MKRGKKGKERLDKYYYMAKEQGYRARSAFKLIQLNKKYDFLSSSRAVVDLCAAPGGWLQVCTKTMPVSSIIVGVDIVPIRPIPNVTTLTADIRTQECRSAIRKELQGWKADVVLHDGAPNVGTAWVQDAYDQNELVLAALHLATDILKAGGTFVTKVFRSRDYNAILGTLRKLFREVTANKPAASRAVSAEVFVVCQSYLAPKKVDPSFFDPKTVFSLEEQEDNLDASGQHIPSVLSKKALKNRKAMGYEDGLSLVTKRISASDFIANKEPLSLLSVATEIYFDTDGAAAAEGSRDAEIRALPATTGELVELMKDLKILGKSEFKQILRWHEQVSHHYERLEKKREAAEAAQRAAEEAKRKANLTQEERQKLLEERIDEEAKALAKAERKKLKKQKKLQERARARVIEGADTLASEAGVSESLFNLSALPASVELDDDDSGNELDDDEINSLDDDGQEVLQRRARRGAAAEYALDDEDEDSEDELAREEEELDLMYEAYLARKSGKNVQVRLDGKKRMFKVPTYAKGDAHDVMPTDDVARAAPLAEMEEDPLEGLDYEDEETRRKNRNALLVSLNDKEGQSSDEDEDEDEGEEGGEEDEEEEEEKKPQMSKRAANWFGDSMFEGIEMGDNEDDEDEDEDDNDDEGGDNFGADDDDVEVIEDSDNEAPEDEPRGKKSKKGFEDDDDDDDDDGKKKKKKKKDGDFEVVPATEHFEIDSDDDEARGAGYGEDTSDDEEEEGEDGEKDSGIIKLGPHMGREKLATALAIGRQISMSKSAKERMIDDSYNRYAFEEDEDDLPAWFVDDERRHMRQILPVSKDQVDAERQRLTAIDSKPIKRIYEAQARKRMRSEKRKEAIRQKANQISEQADIDEAEKARMIGRLYRRAAAKSSRRRKTVLVDGKSMKKIGGAKKGRTKLVDSRMKKDRRGVDRADAKRRRGQRKRKNSVQSHRGKKNKQNK